MNLMAFIPARGGSKGIPRKNLIALNGKPLIQYTVEAAQQSEYINTIFVSSDNTEIITFCTSLGLPVPYRRPPELATDEAPTIAAVLHALDWIQENSPPLPDSIMLLQPTSPLRTVKDIDGAVESFISSGAESLISVHSMMEHPYECLKMKGEGWTYLAKSPSRATRRQDYEDKFYFINGAIYLVKTDFLRRKKAFVEENKTIPYVMHPANGVEIDSLFDLNRAKFYLQHRTEIIS